MFHIVLVHPQIPNNTGNIGRLTAATACQLHLIEPLGFEITDKHLKRAGLDYWPEVNLQRYPDWQSYLKQTEGRRWFLSTHANQPYFEVEFKDGDHFIFGNEATGLPPEIMSLSPQHNLRIPLDNPKVRSLNIANAVSIVLMEARRQMFTSIPDI